MRRRTLGMVIAALAAAVTMPVVSLPAEATAYRYWSYWHAAEATWQFSKIGATGARPADGSVEGWRFAVSPGTASAPAPRQAASTAFSSICGGIAAQSGKKRVALVVDFGVKAHAPSGDTVPGDPLRGTCVVVRSAATGWDVLVAADYAIRSKSSMVCGLAGYPTRGCGETVPDSEVSAAPSKTPTAKATSTSGSGSGSSSGSGSRPGTGTDGDGDGTDRTGDEADDRATSSANATAAATDATGRTPGPSATSTDDAIPTAEALDSSIALPTLVQGAPAADTSGSSSNPLRAAFGLLLVAAVAGGAFFRIRARRPT